MKRRTSKKNRPAPEAAEVPSVEVPDSPESTAGDQVVVSRGADLSPVDANHPLAAPINDLARAFAMQAEMLKVLHENQSKIMETMADDGRSEMMLNSTKALNDTFRGVKEVQEGLIDRLGHADGRGGPGAWVVGLMLSVFVFGGGAAFYWAISSGLLVLGDSEATTEKLARLEEAEEDRTAEQLAGLSQAQAEQASLAAERQQRISELEESLRVSAAQLENQAENNLLRERQSVELKKLQAEAAAADARYNAVRSENKRLSEEAMARLRASFVRPTRGVAQPTAQPIPTPTAVNQTPLEASDSTPASVKVPVAESPDTSRVMATLNRLLLKNRSDHSYRFEAIGSVKSDHLVDVVLVETSGGGDVVKRVEASSLRMQLSGVGGILELQFLSGNVRHGKRSGGLTQPAPFYKGKYRVMVYTLNSVDWKNSRLSFVN